MEGVWGQLLDASQTSLICCIQCLSYVILYFQRCRRCIEIFIRETVFRGNLWRNRRTLQIMTNRYPRYLAKIIQYNKLIIITGCFTLLFWLFFNENLCNYFSLKKSVYPSNNSVLQVDSTSTVFLATDGVGDNFNPYVTRQLSGHYIIWAPLFMLWNVENCSFQPYSHSKQLMIEYSTKPEELLAQNFG